MKMTKTDHFEKIITEEKVYSGKVISLGLRQVKLENGQEGFREVVYHNCGVGIIPVDSEGNVYFVRQYRSAFECEVLEIPAGKLEKGEDHRDAAERELKEETGFTADKFTYLGEMWPTVGYCSEKIYLYLAQGLTKGDTCFDSDEFISLEKMPFEQFYKECLEGNIQDGKTVIAAFRAKKYL